MLILDEPTSGLDPDWPHESAGNHPAAEERGQDGVFFIARIGRSGNGVRPGGHPAPGPTQGGRAGERSAAKISMQSGADFPANHRLSTAGQTMNNVFAIAGVVIKEMIPAQGFLCPVRADGADHADDGVRSVFSRTTTHCGVSQGDLPAADLDFGAGDCDGHGGAADSGGAGKPDDFSAAGQAGDAGTGDGGQISGLLAGLRRGAGGVLSGFWVMSASREHEWRVMNYFLCLWMQWMFLGVVIAMTLWGSLIFAAPSSNATIVLVVVLGILLLGRDFTLVAARLPKLMSLVSVCDIFHDSATMVF